MEDEKIYFSMPEVQTMTGLPSSTLIYWEKKFPQLSPRRDGHRNRYYRQEDIDLVKRIRFIRDEMKITRIEAIRRELEADNRQTDYRQKTAELLQKIKQELINIRSEL